MFHNLYFFIFLSLTISCKSKVEKNEISLAAPSDTSMLKISLAEWSFHKALKSDKMKHLDFASQARALGFGGVEYVNQFFKDKAQDTTYLNLMNQKAKDAGVEQLLIMIDGEGDLGDQNEQKRRETIQNHLKWIDAAAYLHCHSIRVNAGGQGSAEKVSESVIKSLSELSDYASKKNINVIVENHGGYSSDGKWLAHVISSVNKKNCGTLPDFGNFCLESKKDKNGKSECISSYDRYTGVEELIPFAKAVSAKSFDFGELGFETTIDYLRMLEIVRNAGYTGYIGVEYEGESLTEEEGILATKHLIEKCWEQLASESN